MKLFLVKGSGHKFTITKAETVMADMDGTYCETFQSAQECVLDHLDHMEGIVAAAIRRFERMKESDVK